MPLKLIIVGKGKMAKELLSLINADEKLELVKAVNRNEISDLISLSEKADVVIDFSSRSALKTVLQVKLPLVIGTTGYEKQDFEKIKIYSQKFPVFYSANFSIGIAALEKIIGQMEQLFPFTSLDIIDSHHGRKKDAPSGTALQLEKAVKKKAPINHHSIRGGNIIGDHQLIFHSDFETIILKHQVQARAVFAKGALLAAQFISKKKKGLYSLEDLFG